MAQADQRGLCSVEMHQDIRAYTLYCAGPGVRAFVRRNYAPKSIQQIEVDGWKLGGSVIMPDSDGELSGFVGRLNWKADRDTKPFSYYVYATNIAIEGGRDQPVDYKVGNWLGMEDVQGTKLRVRAVDHPECGDAVLVEYERTSVKR
jgi:hypothetical protein